jgi:hypothetical protein
VPVKSNMLGHSFTLQAITELQKSITDVGSKTDRLIRDVDGHGSKIDAIRHQITFVKGALWVVGALIATAIAAGGLYFRAIAH